MNERQQAMYDFAMARVQPGKDDELKAVLTEYFEKMEEMRNGGGFDRELMREMGQKISAQLTPEGAKEYQEWRESQRRGRFGQ